uniref:Sulfate transporter n=1 Tax=Candidatus Kentrum sp. LFY TaxID=2126342 RepID=A0A450WGU9_9GAMM|nr:MAG: Protein of unknown function (DUF3164) [Candidatus Kentron sp. LFY]
MTIDPNDYLENHLGHLIPKDAIPPIDLLRDDTVKDIIAKARAMNEMIKTFKEEIFREVYDFVELSLSQYGVKWGGVRGNITLRSFRGDCMVKLTIAERIAFDERIQAAKTLIDECIHNWTEESRSEVKVMMKDAFNTDKEGTISVHRVLSLRKYDFDDPKWHTAMRAIIDSILSVGTKEYMHFYQRVEGNEKPQPIPINLANV